MRGAVSWFILNQTGSRFLISIDLCRKQVSVFQRDVQGKELTPLGSWGCALPLRQRVEGATDQFRRVERCVLIVTKDDDVFLKIVQPATQSSLKI